MILWRLAVLLCCGALAPSAWAALEQPLTITIERDGESGLEQLALVFRKDAAELVTNSNFSLPPSPTVRLGRYRSPLTPRLAAAREKVEAVHARAEHAGAPVTTQFHGVRVFVAERELEPGSVLSKLVTETLNESWQLGRWRAVTGLAVSWRNRKTITLVEESPRVVRREATPGELGCQRLSGGALVCFPKGFGRAYLQSQSGRTRFERRRSTDATKGRER